MSTYHDRLCNCKRCATEHAEYYETEREREEIQQSLTVVKMLAVMAIMAVASIDKDTSHGLDHTHGRVEGGSQ